MRLKNILHLIKGKYEIVDNDKKSYEADEIDMEKYIVESISDFNGIIRIQVVRQSVIPNNLEQKWVEEHVKQYGTMPNIFDGC